MQDRPTERVRVLLDGLTAAAIVDRVHPYYSGYQFEGEWLDTLKESIEGELDDLDRIARSESARRFAERLEAAAAEGADVTLFGVDYTALPVDADGVPWRVGDMTENGNVVNGMTIDFHGWHFTGTRNDIDPAIHRHYVPKPTVEEVLREFAQRWDDPAHYAKGELVEEYAAKLTLRGDE